MKTQMGFTLIELLVVVLIIGILSAVALPQYQKAVNKTRFSNLRAVAKIYHNAAQAYQLATGEWPSSLDVLAVDLPAGQTMSESRVGQCGIGSGMYCCIFSRVAGWQTDGIVCGQEDYSFAYEYYNGREYCVAKNADAQATALCKKIGGASTTLNLITPTQHRGGYTYYELRQ